MAIDFVKSALNYLSYGTGAFNSILNGASKIAFTTLVIPDTYSTSDALRNTIIGYVVDVTSIGMKINIDATAGGSKVRLAGRSSGADSQKTLTGVTDIGTGSLVHIGGLLDIGGDSMSIFVNGVEDATQAAAFLAATYTAGTPTSVDRIGANDATPPGNTFQWDGRMAETAMYVFGAGENMLAAEWAALGKRYAPDTVHRSNLVFYERFSRPGFVDRVSGLVGTVTGTLDIVTHPAMKYAKRSQLSLAAPATIGNLARRRLGMQTDELRIY